MFSTFDNNLNAGKDTLITIQLKSFNKMTNCIHNRQWATEKPLNDKFNQFI